MKALKDKRILILLIPFFAVIVLYLLRKEDLHRDGADWKAWAKEDIQAWLDKNYVSLDDWESFVEALRKVEIQGVERLIDA